MWLLCECAPSLRAFMSSIMRWRRGVTASVLMGTPVLGEVETPRSSRQATRAAIDDLSVDYCTRRRAPRSGLSRSDLVVWPIADQRVHCGMSATDESGHCGNRVADGF